MFTNLIESQSRRKEFKRRSSFFLFTVAAYAVIIFGAGIGSIYAYDAQLETQVSSLELMSWVPPVTPEPNRVQPARSPASSSSSHTSSQPVRPVLYEDARSPTKPPHGVSTTPNPIPPAPPHAVVGKYISDPATPATNNVCFTCNGTDDRVNMESRTTAPPLPPTPPVKPPTTLRVPSTILQGKAQSLPQPPYPIIAKQSRVQGPVSIQILVSEEGKVLSAQVVSGSAMLTTAAKEAAMRARFSPTMLNGQPVKIQGIITYNFVLQ